MYSYYHLCKPLLTGYHKHTHVYHNNDNNAIVVVIIIPVLIPLYERCITFFMKHVKNMYNKTHIEYQVMSILTMN